MAEASSYHYHSAEIKKKMVTLKSSDEQIFEVEEKVAMQSRTIKHMIEDGCAVEAIPIPNVTSTNLAKVIEYCRKHKKGDEKSQDMREWDAEFMKVLDDHTVSDLILAANYLDINSLLQLSCQTFADRIKDMFPEELRKTFGILNDFTPEEEEALRKESEWAFH